MNSPSDQSKNGARLHSTGMSAAGQDTTELYEPGGEEDVFLRFFREEEEGEEEEEEERPHILAEPIKIYKSDMKDPYYLLRVDWDGVAKSTIPAFRGLETVNSFITCYDYDMNHGDLLYDALEGDHSSQYHMGNVCGMYMWDAKDPKLKEAMKRGMAMLIYISAKYGKNVCSKEMLEEYIGNVPDVNLRSEDAIEEFTELLTNRIKAYYGRS